MEKTVDPVYFEKFALDNAPLPHYYPVLPIKALGHQPAVYAQGNSTTLYVAIMIPLFAGEALEQPQNADLKTSGDSETYTCECSFLVVKDGGPVSDSLAVVKFSVGLPEDLTPDTKVRVAVYVTDPIIGDNVGKVVMDATMLPTQP